MALLYFARHGETDANARLIFQGQTGAGLNARGRAQARRLAERMRRTPLSGIIASDLQRAVETANIVADAVGIEPAIDPDLREVDVGTWSGKDHETIARLHPEQWAAWSKGLDVRRGGGETYAELATRIERAAERGYAFDAPAPILIVSHGGSIKSYVAKVLGVDPEGLAALAGVGNTSLTVLEKGKEGRVRLVGWNDMAHLEGMTIDEHTD